jgi:hypothetical protein
LEQEKPHISMLQTPTVLLHVLREVSVLEQGKHVFTHSIIICNTENKGHMNLHSANKWSA